MTVDPFFDAVEDCVRSFTWSSETTESERTLAVGNFRAGAGFGRSQCAYEIAALKGEVTRFKLALQFATILHADGYSGDAFRAALLKADEAIAKWTNAEPDPLEERIRAFMSARRQCGDTEPHPAHGWTGDSCGWSCLGVAAVIRCDPQELPPMREPYAWYCVTCGAFWLGGDDPTCHCWEGDHGYENWTALEEATVPETASSDGPCMDCGRPNPFVWFTDSVLWNRVVGGPGATSDPGGFLCPTCFVVLAEDVFAPTGWRLAPEWPWRERALIQNDSGSNATTPAASGADEPIASTPAGPSGQPGGPVGDTFQTKSAESEWVSLESRRAKLVEDRAALNARGREIDRELTLIDWDGPHGADPA